MLQSECRGIIRGIKLVKYFRSIFIWGAASMGGMM